MKYIVIVFLFLLRHLIAQDAALSVSVPNSVSPCSPIPLEINGGTPPYLVSILNAVNPTGPALKEFKDVRPPSRLPADTDLPAGAIITFNVKDSKGLTASSDQSSVSEKCSTAIPDKSAITPSVLTNNSGNAVSPTVSNNTAPNGSNNGGNLTNPSPVSAADGAPNITNSYAPANGTQAPTVPPMSPIDSNDGSANLTASSMSLTNSSTSGGPKNATTPATTSINNVTTPNYPARNTTQSQGNSLNITNNKSNQTAKPSGKQISTSSKGPSNSFHSGILITFVVILSAWT